MVQGIACQQKGYILRGKITDPSGTAKLSFELEVSFNGSDPQLLFKRSFTPGVSDSQLECGRNPPEEAEGGRLVLQEGVRGGAKADSSWRAKSYLGGQDMELKATSS